MEKMLTDHEYVFTYMDDMLESLKFIFKIITNDEKILKLFNIQTW